MVQKILREGMSRGEELGEADGAWTLALTGGGGGGGLASWRRYRDRMEAESASQET